MMTSLMILRRRDHLFDQRADDDGVRDNVSVVVDVVVGVGVVITIIICVTIGIIPEKREKI